MDLIDRILETAVGIVWGIPQVIFLIGSGIVLLIFSRFIPYRGMLHSLKILSGKFNNEKDPGEISHFQAMSTALASTVGMGNIGGVAIAITQGGPGALFWMWVAALLGMIIKFFECTLAVMYRGHDSMGKLQGGPMYYIEVGLGKKYRSLAIMFSICGMIGCISGFQANQVAEVLKASYNISPSVTGLLSVIVVAAVILGGISRIAYVASKLVPLMCLLYLGAAIYIAVLNIEHIPAVFASIFHDAFTGTAAAGGAAGIGVATVIKTGVKRAVFSNEAGLGTAPMAHGAARTSEPIREGLVAMYEPLVDTIMICSLTAFIILAAGDWSGAGVQGVALTSQVFEAAMGGFGKFILVVIVLCFGLSTMFGYSYYGKKCFSYLFGAEKGRWYEYYYLATLYIGAVWTASMVVNLVDTAYALMTIPNLIAVILLAPKVVKEMKKYFKKAGLIRS
ncbi:MAG: sodium:alanine symporter family protein [Acidobacteriota bacterium]